MEIDGYARAVDQEDCASGYCPHTDSNNNQDDDAFGSHPNPPSVSIASLFDGSSDSRLEFVRKGIAVTTRRSEKRGPERDGILEGLCRHGPVKRQNNIVGSSQDHGLDTFELVVG